MGLTVIHVDDVDPKRAPRDLPIHRPFYFGNPYHLNASGSNRKAVIEAFEHYIRRYPVMLETIKEIPDGTRLACYCKKPMKTHRMLTRDKPCHGDVIAKIWAELHKEKVDA